MDFSKVLLLVVLTPLIVIAIYIVAKTIATAWFSTRRYYDNWRHNPYEEKEL